MDKLKDFNIENITDIDINDMFNDLDDKGIDLDQNNNMLHNEVNNRENICPQCQTSEHIISDTSSGILVCKACGQVIGELLDANPEWRQYDDDNKGEPARCGMPINQLLPQSSLGTSISGRGRNRIKTLHGWNSMPYKERSLNLVLKEIHSRCDRGNILKCIEDDAKIMYKKISECKHIKGKNKGKTIIIRGSNRKGLIAACVFFACRKKGATRSPKEIADIFDLKYTEITKGCKNLLKLNKIRKIELTADYSSPEHFITRYCHELKIKQEYIDVALKITKNIQKLNIASIHTPISIATGSILLMAEEKGLRFLTKRRIADKFHVSEVTILKTYKKLCQYADIVKDNTATDKIIADIKKETLKKDMPDELKKRLEKINGMTQLDELNNNPKKNTTDNNTKNYIEYTENTEDFEEFEDDEIQNIYDIDKLLYTIYDIKDDIDEIFELAEIMIYDKLTEIDQEYSKVTQDWNDLFY